MCKFFSGLFSLLLSICYKLLVHLITGYLHATKSQANIVVIVIAVAVNFYNE